MPPRYVLKQRLVVVGPTLAGVVRFAGGWLFDRVMAGWDATVLTADHADVRPLRILGASAFDLDFALAVPDRAPLPEIVAIEASLCDADPRVGLLMRQALDNGVSDVRFWGESCSGGLDLVDFSGGTGAVPHRLSFAARAFKAQALTAAAVPFESIDGVEMFRTGQPARVGDVAR